MPFLWDFIANLAAAWAGELLTPPGMTGIAIAVLVIVAWTISWHRRQRAAKKQGMAAWQFIALCFVIAAAAMAAGGYGLGLRNAPEKDGATKPDTTPQDQSQKTAVSRAQPYRLTDNSLPPDQQTIVQVSDSTKISSKSDNTDFQMYKAWLAAGNKPDPVEATLPPVYAARSPSDAEKEIPILDKLYDLIHSVADPLPAPGIDLAKKWIVTLRATEESDSYTKDLDKFYYSLYGANQQIASAAKEYKQYCDNDLCPIVAEASRYDWQLIGAIGDFEIAFHSLSNMIDRDRYTETMLNIKADEDPVANTVKRMNFEKLLSSHVDRIKQLLIAYSVSISWIEYKLLERRAQLSKIASRQ